MLQNTVILDNHFTRYGFSVDAADPSNSSILWRNMDERGDKRTVLFGFYNLPRLDPEVVSTLTMNPAMLDMPTDPAFTIQLEGWEAIYEMLRGQHLLADTLGLPMTKVAEYLGLRHLTRKAGQRRHPQEIVGALLSRDSYWERLATLNLI